MKWIYRLIKSLVPICASLLFIDAYFAHVFFLQILISLQTKFYEIWMYFCFYLRVCLPFPYFVTTTASEI